MDCHRCSIAGGGDFSGVKIVHSSLLPIILLQKVFIISYDLIFKIGIELKMLLCYIINTKGQSPTRWFDQFNDEIEFPPFTRQSFKGGFSM